MSMHWLRQTLLLTVLLSSTFCAYPQSKKNSSGAELHRIFHHTCIAPQDTTTSPLSHIELGQIVLYFTQEPIVNKIPRIAQGQQDYQQLELFFPHATIKGLSAQELEKKMVDTTGRLLYSATCAEGSVPVEELEKKNEQQDKDKAAKLGKNKNVYVTKLEKTKQPIPGIRCTITYHKDNVAFDYDTFLSISAQHAVRLRFFNKRLLNKITKEHAMLRVAEHKPPRIILDCGHGGKDAGAIGVGRVLEKEVTLSIGLEVAQLLREQGFDVYMTRERDMDLALDARTSFANAITHATALVSIHANASANPLSAGIETFYINPSLFKSQEKLLNSQQAAIVDHYQKELHCASKQLATVLHHHVLNMAHQQQRVSNRNVKSAAAQVLVGTQIPATLIEIGFVSNATEAALLSDKRYQKLLAQGICNGIVAYNAQLP